MLARVKRNGGWIGTFLEINLEVFINTVKELCNINNPQHCHNYPDIIIIDGQIRLSFKDRTLNNQTY